MTCESTEDEIRDATYGERALRHSHVAGLLRTIGSRIEAGLRRFETYLEGARLYRWLTKEPETDVVVIDLRETVTVVWFIRFLDGLVDAVQPYWEESALKRLIAATVAAGHRFSRTRLGRAFSAVLAPPEPRNPGRGDDDEASADACTSRDGPDDESDS
jgi:hypothetical protein